MSDMLASFGDEAFRFAVPSGIAARRVLLERLRAVPGVVDVVLCEDVGLVRVENAHARAPERACAIERALGAPIDETGVAASERHVVRVRYNGADLVDVAGQLGVSVDAVVALHHEREYTVSMLGFLPGFAYLRGLAPELCLPRRAPRPRVPARSVAIGAEYTGVYPVASAGGWHLLGSALDVARFALGDRVTFVPSKAAQPEPTTLESTRVPTGPHLVITRLAGLALFVDRGRPGRMHEGMPPGGPLVRTLFARANANAENASGACAIELTGNIEVEARGGTLTIADDERATTLRDGERFTLTSGPRRARYLALEGGIDAPLLEGSRNALLAAGLGRPLRRGDTLCPDERRSSRAPAGAEDEPGARGGDVPVAPADDLPREVVELALRGAFSISPVSDRTGTRLVALDAGGSLEAPPGSARRASAPMIEGAIELTPSGLVVLGPDGPTTGGYPVVGVVRAGSRDAFFGLSLGAAVRFRIAP